MKKCDKIFTGLICLFFLGMSLLYAVLPSRAFSPLEKRYLTQAPTLTAPNLLSGRFGDEVENYMADQMPGRDWFVGLNAYYERALGLQRSKDIWVVVGKLVRRPVQADDDALTRRAEVVERFARNQSVPVTLSLIPSAGWAAGDGSYQDEALIDAVYGAAQVEHLSLTDTFRGRPELFYNTDHHWTSQGAFEAYRVLMNALERKVEERYTVEAYPHFRGANYASSCLWLTGEETLEMWHAGEITVNPGTEQAHEGVFYPAQLDSFDPYTVFLGGNQPLVELYNPAGSGKLLVIRDSFSNCLGGFLAQSYEQVTLVDLRYHKRPVSELLAEADYDRVLILYSLENFLTDQNLPLLR